MAIKSAYKEKPPDAIPADSPQTEFNGAEAAQVAAGNAEMPSEPEPVAATSTAIPPEPEIAPEAAAAMARAEQEATQADQAKFALLRQIEAMRQAEQFRDRQRLQYERFLSSVSR